MGDLETRLRQLGDEMALRAPSELSPTPDALRRIRVGRTVRGAGALAVVVALAVGGIAGAQALKDDQALPPVRENSSMPFVDTWTSTDVEGRTRTLIIRATGEDTVLLTLRNNLSHVCSGSSSTLEGTGRVFGARLTIVSPVITCDDGSAPRVESDLPPPEELLANLTFEYEEAPDILTNFSPLEERRVRSGGQAIYSGRTLVWGRAGAQNRVGDIGGTIAYGDGDGIWARDLTDPNDPANRVSLSPAIGDPLEWSRDGSKLLLRREVPRGDDAFSHTDLFVLDADGLVRVTDTGEWLDGGSFSPDGTEVIYAIPEGIYATEIGTGSTRLIRPAGDRLIDTSECPGSEGCVNGQRLFDTTLEAATLSPDGSEIAFFDGMGDWGHSLQVMDSDGTGVRVVVENRQTLEAGHVYGLQWSPDGDRLAFSLEGRLYTVGADGSDLRLIIDGGVQPYWSPDGSHIAYTRLDEQSSKGGSLEIVRLEDLRAQNFGDGKSGPWREEM